MGDAKLSPGVGECHPDDLSSFIIIYLFYYILSHHFLKHFVAVKQKKRVSASQVDRARLAGLQPETLADMSVTHMTLTMKASKCWNAQDSWWEWQ